MKKLVIFLCFAAVLCGCGKTEETSHAAVHPGYIVSAMQEAVNPAIEAVAMAELPDPAVPVVLAPEAPGELESRCDDAVIDYSRTADGYIMVKYLAETDSRLKVLVQGPTTRYSYNLPKDEWTVFPLSDGSGSYQVGVYINVTGSKYATVMTASFDVSLNDEFAPFLRPNQYVNYSEATQAVAKGAELSRGLTDPLDKVAAVYDYVVSTLTYDYDRAETVKSGYLPVLDQVLEEKKGICFDYAALMTAMLRSQEVPCKLVVGYAGSVYHAWISVWTEESGWIDGAIFFDGSVWHRMDPTFASSGSGDAEIMDFIQNGAYTVKYLY